MEIKPVKISIIFLVILLFLYVTSGECEVYSYKIESNAQFEYSFHDTWVIYNVDPSLDYDKIMNALSYHGGELCFDFIVVDLTKEDSSKYIEYLPFSVKNYVGIDEREYYPFGKSIRSVVIMPLTYKVVANGCRGGAYGERAFVVFDNDHDTLGTLKIRLLHEISHCYKRDADGLFSTKKNEFYVWMIDTGYIFSDFYTNGHNYYTAMMSPKEGCGEIVYVDYIRWLLSKI